MLNQNTRYFIYRESPSVDVIANVNNQLQEVAEKSRLGIPAVIISNPRNHSESTSMVEDLDMERARKN